MPSKKPILIALLAILVAIYKIYFHDILTIVLGIGLTIQPLEDFPQYRCTRIRHPLLESCEDIWLDHADRKLYAACSNPLVRAAWSPGGNAFNLTARAAAGGGTDHVTTLDADRPGVDSLRELQFRGRDGSVQELDLHGFDVRERGNGVLRFWLINHRPPVDGEGRVLELDDASGVGANSTVEVYDLAKNADHLVYVTTIVSDAIVSPNNLVAVDDDGDDVGGFLVTNDHSSRAGALRGLTPLTGGGSVAYCRTDTGKCHIAAQAGSHMPNGIAQHPASGLIHVAQSARGRVTVYELTADRKLAQVDELQLPMGIDNLSIDQEGNIFAGAFPDILQLRRAFDDPYNVNAPSTVLKIQLGESGRLEVVKVVEDGAASVLPTTATAVHDPVSGRLFLSGVASPFIGVCERVG